MDDSREPLLVQFWHTPLTALISLSLLLIWFPLWNNRVPPEGVAFSYKRVVEGREYWRVFTAAFAHMEFFHLFFNMTSLWSCRAAELIYGSGRYFLLSLALVVSSKLLTLAIYHILATRFGISRYIEQFSVGYSAVIFGWMTVLSFLIEGNMSVLGLFEIPGPVAPFFSLLITQVLVRSASFVGHFTGILAGYLVLLQAFSFLSGAYWTAVSVFWLIMVVLTSVKATTSLPVPCIDYVNFTPLDINSLAAMEEGGTRASLVEQRENEEEEEEEELLLRGLAANNDTAQLV